MEPRVVAGHDRNSEEAFKATFHFPNGGIGSICSHAFNTGGWGNAANQVSEGRGYSYGGRDAEWKGMLWEVEDGDDLVVYGAALLAFNWYF